jgi:hypothetical protein
VLSEREEELKDVKAERARLEIEAEGFQQRLKSLDESENRYKDENWNLETQIHELIAAQKEGAEREKKLAQTLNVIQSEKSAVQRELEETKHILAKQDEKHTAEIKNLEIELGTIRRNAVVFETERSVLQRKVDELTGQNQELAKAFSSLQRGRLLERESGLGVSEEDFHSAPDHNTPEHSPPPSPMKATPRHSALESETLKTSLGHAQRTIQTLRTNIHREKTEKLELKRMLQDARDEIEKLRNDPHPHPPKKSRKIEARETKKPLFKLTQLGSVRPSRTEVVEDPEWEDQSEVPPPRPLSRRSSTLRLPANNAVTLESNSDHFETANETSDAAFETAHERGTETEDFQTGVEDLSDDDAATETEAGPSRGASSIKRPPPLPPHQSSNHYSFDSTASTSSDEDDYPFVSEMKTPSASRMRMRVSRGSLGSRRSRQFSEEPSFQSSPASVHANSASATPGGQSLFAELNELDNSDEESLPGAATPGRRSIRSTPATPRSTVRGRSPPPEVPALPKVMVDSGMMTEPVFVGPVSADAETQGEREIVALSPRSDTFPERPMSMQSVIGPRTSHASTQWLGDELKDESSRPISAFSYSDASVQNDWDLDAKLAQFPSPPGSQSVPPTLSMTSIHAEFIEPLSEPEIPSSPPSLSVSSILHEQTEPAPQEVPPLELPNLSVSPLISEHVEPREPEAPLLSIPATVASQDVEPIPPAPIPLSLSTVHVEQVEPVAEVETPPPPPAALSFSTVLEEQVEPVAEPEIPMALSFSAVVEEQVEPVAEPEISPPSPVALSFSAIVEKQVEPVVEPEPIITLSPTNLTFSGILGEQVEPVELPAPAVDETPALSIGIPLPASLALSSIISEHVEPQSQDPPPVPLSLSPINVEEVAPAQEPASPAPVLAFVPLQTQHVEPLESCAPPLSLSSVETWAVEPLDALEVPPMLSLSAIEAQVLEPIELDEPLVAPALSVSAISSLHTEPSEPRSPKRNAFIIPRDVEDDDSPAQASSRGVSNVPVTADQGAQTSLTADAISQLFREKARSSEIGELDGSNSLRSMGTPSTVRIHRPRQESFDGTGRSKGKAVDVGTDAYEAPPLRRIGSSASALGGSLDDVPPLPPNHKEVIEAARSGSSQGGQGTIGSMGPPLFPASALKAQNQPFRPRTPTGARRPLSPISVASGRGTPTPRAATKSGFTPAGSEVQSLSKMTSRSRKSSISSFTSEVDTRFNMHSDGGFQGHGLGSNTDPRMIQAITQTMIGEYLWKYTRKAGREEMSENRHRRYFWVHPYTRMLYWSDRDPSTGGRHEVKAKSVPIEAVRVVADDNPMPPGLHRKSLVIISPGRSVKFTCTTGQRHETWFNALSYLLLRTTSEGQTDAEEMAGNITREDVEEFNPSYRTRRANGNRMAPSLSSYNSQHTPRDSPTMDITLDVPTLTPSRSKASQGRTSFGTLSRISGYWKESKVLSGTFGSLKARSVSGRDPVSDIYESSEVQDSAEDVRQMIERQDREADRLENVRACCDGEYLTDLARQRCATWILIHSRKTRRWDPDQQRETWTPFPSGHAHAVDNADTDPRWDYQVSSVTRLSGSMSGFLEITWRPYLLGIAS